MNSILNLPRGTCLSIARRWMSGAFCFFLSTSVAFSQTPVATVAANAAVEKDSALIVDSKIQPAFGVNGGMAPSGRNDLPPLVVPIPGRPFLNRAERLAAMDLELRDWISLYPSIPEQFSGVEFEGLGFGNKMVPNIRAFIEEVLIPNEAKYFELGLGMDENTGLPFDHIRYRLKSKIMTEVGNYTAASKLSLSIPFLLNIIQQKPAFDGLEGWTPAIARHKLLAVLKTLTKFNREFSDYRGFLPWVDIRPNGTIAPANTKIPSLDNGQLTWALAGVVSVFDDADTDEEHEIKALAESLLAFQNYANFYDEKAGLLHGTIQVSFKDGHWVGDQSYYLNDMYEGTMAVLWAVLHGQVPESAWTNLKIPTVDYQTLQGETVTTFQGYRSSFHEWWALAFLPYMQSNLAPLFYNYLYAQADHAIRKKSPGFASTGFDAQGVYRQMGVPALAGQKVDRDDVSVVFGTSIAMLISPSVGSVWLKNLYESKGLVTPYGAVESLGPDGFADIFTADGKGMTLLAASGGISHEIERYLKSRRYLDTRLTLYEKLMQLFEAKYQQMLAQRGNRPVFIPKNPISLPPDNSIEPHSQKPPSPGQDFDVTDHFQQGHLHGKNVTSAGEESLEDDVRAGEPMAFDYEIPPQFIYFDQWAFRGTYIDEAVRIANMNYLMIEIPVRASPATYQVELKSDDITLAAAEVKTTDQGFIPPGSKTKTIVYPIHPIPESDYKAFNYLSISLNDPRYSSGPLKAFARRGHVVINSIKLSREHPFLPNKKHDTPTDPNASEIPMLKFWRLTHGDMIYKENPWQGSLVFDGGVGWRGGYLPYTDVHKYRYLYLKVRNKSGACNCFGLEMKHESNQLLGQKMSIKLDPSGKWQIFEIKIPEKAKRSFNYMALSDSFGQFEISSAFLSESPIRSFSSEKVDTSGKKPQLRCQYQCPLVN